MAIAAGDYPLCFIQWWNSYKSLMLQWAATAKSTLAVQLSSAAIQRILSCEFRIYLAARTIFTRLYMEKLQ